MRVLVRPTKRITREHERAQSKRNLIKTGPRKTGSFTFPLMDGMRSPASPSWITQHVSTVIIQFAASGSLFRWSIIQDV